MEALSIDECTEMLNQSRVDNQLDMSHLHQSVMNRTILENVSVMIDRVPEEEDEE